MKKLLLLILAISLLAGCTRETDGLTYKSYYDIDDIYIATFEDSNGEDVSFRTLKEYRLKGLEEGQTYKVSYFYNSHFEFDYTISSIEIYNETLEKE